MHGGIRPTVAIHREQKTATAPALRPGHKVTWHWAPRLAVAKYGNRGVGDVDGARTGTP